MNIRFFYLLLIGFCLMCLFQCKDKKKKRAVFLESNGRMNHLLIVMDDKHWNDTIGRTLKKFLSVPLPGLPQTEYPMDITRIPHKNFGRMFRASRNVLSIKVGDSTFTSHRTNVYAKPQQFITFQGKTAAETARLLYKNSRRILSTYRAGDLKMIRQKQAKKAYPKGTFKTLKNMGLKLTIPKIFRLVEDTGNFLWLRQHLSGGIAKGDSRSALLVYSAPYQSHRIDEMTLFKVRDSIGKQFLKGDLDDSFMITEAAYTPIIEKIKFKGRTCYRSRGKWELLGDFMAGPFLNYMIADPEHRRWIVIEAYVYAPSVDKRDYLFEAEAMMGTLELLPD